MAGCSISRTCARRKRCSASTRRSNQGVAGLGAAAAGFGRATSGSDGAASAGGAASVAASDASADVLESAFGAELCATGAKGAWACDRSVSSIASLTEPGMISPLAVGPACGADDLPQAPSKSSGTRARSGNLEGSKRIMTRPWRRCLPTRVVQGGQERLRFWPAMPDPILPAQPKCQAPQDW